MPRPVNSENPSTLWLKKKKTTIKAKLSIVSINREIGDSGEVETVQRAPEL